MTKEEILNYINGYNFESTFVEPEPNGFLERTINRRKYEERVEEERKQFIKDAKIKKANKELQFDSILDNAISNLIDRLNSKDNIKVTPEDFSERLKRKGEYKDIDFRTVFEFVNSGIKHGHQIKNESLARLYVSFQKAIGIANKMYDEKQDVEFVQNDRKTLIYSHDMGRIYRLFNSLGIKFTKNDCKNVIKFLRQPSHEVRSAGFDENINVHLDNNSDMWKRMGVDLSKIESEVNGRTATNSSTSQSATKFQSEPERKVEGKTYSFNFSQTSQNTQTTPPKETKTVEFVDTTNLTTLKLIKDAYDWYDEYCKNEVQKAIAEGKGKINDAGYYNIQDPSGKTIAYSLHSSVKKDKEWIGMASKNVDGQIVHRSSRELSREAHIIYDYIWNSGKFKTDLIGDKSHPETCAKSLSDDKIRKFNEYFIDNYQRTINNAKAKEERESGKEI